MTERKQINRLKIVLAEQYKTNKWLAKQLGKSLTTVSRWCTNESQPRIETMIEIAAKLNVDARELIVSTKQEK
jgi:putative transcriptional regulator